MMIAIVILGLGLVMTATMFPVAWQRARTLTEFTTQRSVASSAESTLGTLLHAAGPSVRVVYVNGTNVQMSLLSAGSLAGDFFYDPTLAQYGQPAIVAYSDTRVHALNTANILVVPPPGGPTASPIVDEDPWKLERMFDIESTTFHPIFGSGYPVFADNDAWKAQFFLPNSFYMAQVPVEQRVSPPLQAFPTVAGPAQDKWRDKFSTRRFAWTVLHRLRSRVGPPDPYGGTLSPQQLTLAADASGTTRVFDMYVVTLRRTQPSNRYAMQDPQFAPNSLNSPDPTKRDRSVVATPQALPDQKTDVILPVPWRVQIEIPAALNMRNPPPNSTAGETGVPTEVQVPPTGVSASSAAMLVGMFPTGTQFVDEVNGQVYRVTKRRENATGDTAFLTLDRELLWEDFDDSDDPVFNNNFQPDPQGRARLDPDEIMRTVWVFPPAVDRSLGSDTAPVFDGSSPVVGIDVRTVSLSPPG